MSWRMMLNVLVGLGVLSACWWLGWKGIVGFFVGCLMSSLVILQFSRPSSLTALAELLIENMKSKKR